ncbi:MAG TPA: hypothetical protein VN426_06255 [Syntrophomonadaceae bacterium]|nr:hypothetical protein [Syntrophomonadaceae bacterium]
MNDKIKQLVDEYAKWERLIKDGKVEIEKIKAQIQEIAVSEMENSKHKTTKYYGTESNVAIVTKAETVKMASFSFLRSVLGSVTGDFVKEDVTYKMTDPFKKMVAPLCQGGYIEQKLADVIEQMHVDEATAKVLKKKLKGDPDRDMKILTSAGIPDEDIEYWVYFIAEAVAYEKIVKLLEVSGHPESTPEFYKAIQDMKLALIVEESLKIGIEYEEAAE